MKNTVSVTDEIAVMEPLTENQSPMGLKQPLWNFTSNKIRVLLNSVSVLYLYIIKRKKPNPFST